MIGKSHYALIAATAFASGLVGLGTSASAQVSLTGAAYGQEFNDLPSSGAFTFVDNTTLSGWFSARSGTGVTTAGDGSSASGGLYSFGTGADPERALGTVGSGTSGNIAYGAWFTNNTGATIDSFTLSYTGEQWRHASGGAHAVDFSYRVGGTVFTTPGGGANANDSAIAPGNFTAFTGLNFTAPLSGGTGVAINGNDPLNQANVSGTVSGLTIAPGQSFWIRFYDRDHTGNDQGLAIDHLSLTYTTTTGNVIVPLIWDSNTGAAGAQDGPGTWANGSTNFWDPNATPPAQGSWNNATPAEAQFGAGSPGAGAHSVAIDAGGITAKTVHFAAGDDTYTLNGSGTLTLNGNALFEAVVANNDATIAANVNATTSQQIWSVASGKTLTVSGAVSGTDITFGGSGTVLLTNPANSFANFHIAGATVPFSNVAVLGAGELFLEGGTLQPTATMNVGRVIRAVGATTLDVGGSNVVEFSGDVIGGGGITKTGTGTVIFSNPSDSADPARRMSGTMTVNGGTVKYTAVDNFFPVTSGAATINSGGTLELTNIQYGIPGGFATGRIFLNNGGTFQGTGDAKLYRDADALTIQNNASATPGTVDLKTVNASDTFLIGRAVRQATALTGTSTEQDTNTTIRVSGPGTVILSDGRQDGATSAFAGSWQIDSGTLKITHAEGGNIGQGGHGEPLNALGFKIGDASKANKVTINGGTLAVGVDQPNPQIFPAPTVTPPSYLQSPIVLAGGAVAATGFQIDATGAETATPVSANLGGALTTTAATTSKILTYDPAGTGARTVNVLATGDTTLNGALVIDAGATTGGIVNFVRTGGTVTVGSGASINVQSGATVNLSGTNILYDATNAVALTVGGTFNVAPNGNYTSKVSNLSIGAAGKLNLNDNDLIVDHNGSVAENTIRQYVRDGRAPSSTSGIFSTPGPETDDRVLAIADNAEWGKTSFNSIAIDATTIVGKYTFFGDANLDGAVTGDDYLAVDSGLGLGNSWIEGDFNMDGFVTGDDYLAVDANLGKGTPTPLAFAELKAEMVALHAAMFGEEYLTKLADVEANGMTTALVPEPGALSLVGLGAIGLLGRRRRRA